MSDLMFFGVLRMPYEMAMSDDLSRLQFWQRAQEAADRVEAAEKRLAELESATPPSPSTAPTAEMIERMKSAIEGECDGLAINDEHAAAILAYVLESASSNAQQCTCPSGDGSLRWPCPEHPPSTASNTAAPGLEASEKAVGNQSVTASLIAHQTAPTQPLCDSALREVKDDLYDKAVVLVRAQNRASLSLVQRTFLIGYNRTARLFEAMEREGVVSPLDENGHRTVLPSNSAPAGAAKGGNTKPDFSKFATLDEYQTAIRTWDCSGSVDVEEERPKFLSWWRASKYCQVVNPKAGWEQIALDGWIAARRTQAEGN